MKILRDFACWECKVKLEAAMEYKEYPVCPKCSQAMEILFTACNFDSHFAGSHNCEYGTDGPKFKTHSKEEILETVTYSKRVGSRINKKGLKGQEVDNAKHYKKLRGK